MIVTCEKCKAIYEDIDHLTYCPHDYFEKLSFEEICEKNDVTEGLPIGTTATLIKAMF